MNIKHIVIFIFILLIGGCHSESAFYSYYFRLRGAYNYTETTRDAAMVDIKGDDSQYLARVFNEGREHNSLVIFSRGGKALSQINDSSAEFRNVKTLKNPQDGSSILFYSANNGRNLSLRSEKYSFVKPLRRESRYFEPYWRDDDLMEVSTLRWAANFIPLYLEDIDGDGRLELVVNALDSYAANPRGLMVYDYESGKQKWFVKSPVNLPSVVFEDLDGDGYKEFVLGSSSFKNTSASLHGLDDHSGFLVMIDRFGKIQSTEKLMDGTSDILVQALNLNQDGTKDLMVYALKRSPEASDNKLIHYRYNGKHLQRVKDLELAGTLDTMSHPEFAFRLDRSNEYKIILKDPYTGLQLYDTDFNLLQKSAVGMDYLLCTSDFLGDGRKQLLFLDKTEHLVLLNNNLKAIAKLPHPEPGSNVLKAQAFKPATRNKPILMLATERKIFYYEIVHISLPLYLYNWLKTYAIWLSLILLLILIHLFVIIRSRTRSLLQTLNISERAFILVNSKMRIIYINKRSVSMSLKPDNSKQQRYLPNAFPALVEPLTKVQLAAANYEEAKISIDGKDYGLSIERLSSFRKRYLILLTPLSSEADTEVLAWADTARRLSHHVRRHITNVVLAVDYLDTIAAVEAQEYLQIVRSEIDKIRVFTHAFQRFSEMSSLDLKLIDIVPHVEHTLEQARLAPNIKLIKSFTAKSVHAFIEPVRFEEALLNTINNASEAMRDGGSLHVSIRVFPKHGSPKGNLSVLVEVEDSGKGIPAKYMQDIWMPFFTTNQSGTGIGIPETKKILDSMGGILDIQSEEGVGCTVSLWLKGETDG